MAEKNGIEKNPIKEKVAAEKPKFSVEEALNNPAFLKFLEGYEKDAPEPEKIVFQKDASDPSHDDLERNVPEGSEKVGEGSSKGEEEREISDFADSSMTADVAGNPSEPSSPEAVGEITREVPAQGGGFIEEEIMVAPSEVGREGDDGKILAGAEEKSAEVEKPVEIEPIEEELTEAELERRYNAFLAKEALEKVIFSVYDKEIKETLGIELGDEEKSSLLEFLDEEARTNPERITERAEQYENYKKIQEEVKRNDDLIVQLGGEKSRNAALVKLKAEEGALKAKSGDKIGYGNYLGSALRKAGDFLSSPKSLLGAGVVGGFGALIGMPFLAAPAVFGLYSGALKGVEFLTRKGVFGKEKREQMMEKDATREKVGSMKMGERKKYFADIDKKVEAIRNKIAGLNALSPENLAEAKNGFNQARETFFMQFEGTKKIYEAALLKSWKELSDFSWVSNISKANYSFDEIEAWKKRLDGFSKTAEKFDISPSNFEESQTAIWFGIDFAVHSALDDLFARNVDSLKGDKNAFSKLFKSFEPILARERVGNFSKEQVKEMLRNEIRKQIVLATSQKEKSKAILLKGLLIKIPFA